MRSIICWSAAASKRSHVIDVMKAALRSNLRRRPAIQTRMMRTLHVAAHFNPPRGRRLQCV